MGVGKLRELIRVGKDETYLRELLEEVARFTHGDLSVSVLKTPVSIIGSLGSGKTVLVEVSLSDADVTISADLSHKKVSKILECLLTPKLAGILVGRGLGRAYVSLSKISKSVHLLIEGSMPEGLGNIKVITRDNYFEVSSNFCRITPSLNTCSYLMKLLEAVRDLRKEVFH